MRCISTSFPCCAWLLGFVLLTTPLAAQFSYDLPEDPGPYGAGWQDVTFTDNTVGTGLVQARLFYPAITDGENAPADQANGPYPLVAILHGWMGSATGFDTLGSHLASRGYLVAATDTEKGFNASTPDFAADTHALLHWVETESTDNASWLYGMEDSSTDWSAIGHSMGGGTLSLLIGLEPRVQVLIGLQPAEHDPPGPSNMASFSGVTLNIAGAEDRIVPTRVVRRWYDRAVSADRRIMVEVGGVGHSGCTDGATGTEAMRLHKRLVTGFLDAEILGRDEDYETFFGEMVAWQEPFDFDVDFQRPALWGGRGRGNAMNEMGIVGSSSQVTQAAWSLSSGSFSTPFGIVGLDMTPGQSGFTPIMLFGADARVSGPVHLQAAWMGRTVYYQAAAWEVTPLGVLIGDLTQVLALLIT